MMKCWLLLLKVQLVTLSLGSKIGQNALEKEVTSYIQETHPSFRFLYFKHELICLLFRKRYYKTYFKEHFKSKESIHWATFDKNDWKPFIFDQYKTLKALIGRCLKTLKIVSE